MKIEEIYAFPNRNVLKKIVSGPQLEIASPFYSSASLRMIPSRRIEKMAFITRLPNQYIMPSAFIENDPTALASLFGRLNNRLELFALPSLHAKLYLNGRKAWVGSANFTSNGFSEKAEIVIRCDDDDNTWSGIFADYRRAAHKVSRSDLAKLVRWIDLGLTKVRTQAADGATGQGAYAPLTFEDFVKWLRGRGQRAPMRQHILDRVGGKNFMSGHVPPAFHGVTAFLRLNSEYLGKLERVDDTSIPEDVLADFASFVANHGDEYRGSRGGYWRRYLSTRLGGIQRRGGAGDTIAKKCLVLVPAYLKARRQLQFG